LDGDLFFVGYCLIIGIGPSWAKIDLQELGYSLTTYDVIVMSF
jgi:hypothetical protein